MPTFDRAVRIVLLGDSQLTDASPRDVTKLGPRLRRRGYEVDTRAVGGLDTRRALLRTEDVRPGDWAIYCFGANDAAPWKQVPPDEFAANYAALLGRSSCRQSLVLGPAPVTDSRIPGGRTSRAIARYSELASDVADRLGARFISLLDALGSDDLADDGVHLNGHGYDIVERLCSTRSEQPSARRDARGGGHGIRSIGTEHRPRRSCGGAGWSTIAEATCAGH